MNNFTPSAPTDEASLPDGDLQFIGVEERTEFSGAGYVYSAQNCRFRTKRCATRDGITVLPWCLGNGLTPFTDVYGGFVYADPNGVNQYILIAAQGGVYYTRPNTVAKSIPLPQGVVLTRDTFKKFIQGNASILLLRGFSDDGKQLLPLQLGTNADGSPDFQTGFKVIQQENIFEVTLDAATNRVLMPGNGLLVGDPVQFAAGTTSLPVTVTAGQTYYVLTTPTADAFTISASPGGTQLTWNLTATDTATYDAQMTILDGAYPIPEAVDGIFAQNRFFLIDSKDTFLASDIGDFTRYVPTQEDFRINQGDAYTLKYLYLFNESTLLAFKSGSVMKVTNVTGDLTGATGPLNVTQAYGMAAPSVADIGTDVYWLNSELRVTSLNLTELNKEQGTNNALSDPLINTFQRINPQYANRARLTVFDGYLLVALPLDDAVLLGQTNVVPAGLEYVDNRVTEAIPTVAGQTYQFYCGNNDVGLLDPWTLVRPWTTFIGDQTFVPVGAYVGGISNPNLDVSTNPPCTLQMYPVLATGVNTAVAVYDFYNQAWCGTDEAPGVVCVVDWLKFDYNGRQQLAFIGADGFIHLYAEGYEDEIVEPVAQPYLDMFCDQIPYVTHYGPPYTLDTLQINGGTLITQDLTSTVNTSTTWSVGVGVVEIGNNLWEDTSGNGGFNPSATNPWSAGSNCTVTPIADGIRIVMADGSFPTLLLNGVALQQDQGIIKGQYNTFTYYFDWHGGNAITPIPIQQHFLTRAYPCKSWTSYAMIYTTGGRMDFKDYKGIKLHLATWNAEYTISTQTQGQGDLQAYVTDQTRNFLNYLSPIDAPSWTPDNSNDDFHKPGREDYSFTEPGSGLFLYSGVNFDQLQTYTDTVPLNERGLFVQVDVVNSQGRLELVGLQMEAETGDTLSNVAVKA